MGKRQHQSDKMYITGKEWAAFYGGHKKTVENADFRRLPFFCCSISLQPVENPMCTIEGHVFDLLSIVPWLKKYGTNPITGKKMEAKSLVKMTFHKNADGKYHCPVLFKVFNENTHIVAIATTGNVYCYDAVEQLNIKPKNWRDLLTDKAFTRADIITIQDPSNLDKFNLQNFYHLKHNQQLPDADLKAKSDPKYYMKSTNAETSQTLDELYKNYKGDEILREKPAKKQPKLDKFNTSNFSTGKVSASFTSTARTPALEQEVKVRETDAVRYDYVKKKGYVRLCTNLGDLNLELQCDMVPKTCENFIKLCKKGYYDGTIFHRLIRNFMIQGGDPSGTGRGGESAWGEPFADEFRSNLSHSERGILSMANSGKNTNKSQFFITFRSCKHLDRKHTIFGKLVGGLATLSKLEAVETDKKTDIPSKKIVLERALVFVDPFEEADEKLANLRQEEIEAKQKEEEELRSTKRAAVKPKVFKKGVGKYINSAVTKNLKDDVIPVANQKRQTKLGSQLNDFSSW
uniref:RING-type E3 ubiquitin-protein ligase PPIL2 n=1 Tax=Phallusia mammillata TaxID=59560 RepID=A0A6F9DQ07_9ASCI|nr:peptidyl-prolyl cis-trans isomerase-like 2 [Phallusia mammillata]